MKYARGCSECTIRKEWFVFYSYLWDSIWIDRWNLWRNVNAIQKVHSVWNKKFLCPAKDVRY